jgi:hypothetical protein
MGVYNKTTWANGGVPAINAANLQKIEDQLEAISDNALTLNSGLICAPKANIPEYPDNVAGTTYFQDAWATVDGWSIAVNNTPTTPGGALRMTFTASGSGASLR